MEKLMCLVHHFAIDSQSQMVCPYSLSCLMVSESETSLYLFFDHPHCDIAYFIGEKYNGSSFVSHFVPEVGSFVRFSTEEEARTALTQYAESLCAMTIVSYFLRNLLNNQNSPSWSHNNRRKSDSSLDISQSCSVASSLGNYSSEPASTTDREGTCEEEIDDILSRSAFGYNWNHINEHNFNNIDVAIDLPLIEDEITNLAYNPPAKSNVAMKNEVSVSRVVDLLPKNNLSSNSNTKKEVPAARVIELLPKNNSDSNFLPVAGPMAIVGVLEVIRRTSAAPHSSGWRALREVWGIGPASFKPNEFRWLQAISNERRTILLMNMAVYDLTNKDNISPLLQRLSQLPKLLCIRFLAGMCHQKSCPCIHPNNTPGWNKLKSLWGLTYVDLSLKVLLYLSQQTYRNQEAILKIFNSMDLNEVPDLSKCLLNLIHNHIPIAI